MSHGSMVEALPGKLYWAPLREAAPEGFQGDFVHALDLCKHGAEEGKAPPAEYNVMHYSLKAAGRAFGPFGLDLMLRFCRGIASRLQGADGRALAVGTAAGDENQRTNVAVMFGAYLLLVEGVAVERVVSIVGNGDAELAFACSWSRKDRPEAKRNMTVRDCWDGLALGLQLGWLDAESVKTDETAIFIATRWREMVAKYDCSWVVPGFILVGADPITTALDPNPATFTMVFPTGETTSMPNVAPPAGSPSSPSNPQGSDGASSAPAGSDAGAALTKEYSLALRTPMLTSDNKALDFATFLKGAGASAIIRTNYADEPGMPKSGGYDAEKFKALGISHTDVFIVDTHGGLPKKADVAKALEACPDGKQLGGAIYVHCKGGFGRSIVLACCLAIERLDIPGTALLGWVRMVRPGCVNTPQQELLLKSFRGANDVRRFAGLPPDKSKRASEGVATDGAKCGCAVQ
eukprot:CAMPEP_0176017872 /NCGR_PEP_ID=MMETSP0120_2-20121206/8585_1 /TAXON_ID=160619 /ORGANISM="Kryptoperidinium foliaceum, Strain CCMP 1326" /LENGTH=462 /DNA_ID=CAMNT_0017350903 /DNA_START=27 /DNA_END=1415 /DNA_ORIENTATION=-